VRGDVESFTTTCLGTRSCSTSRMPMRKSSSSSTSRCEWTCDVSTASRLVARGNSKTKEPQPWKAFTNPAACKRENTSRTTVRLTPNPLTNELSITNFCPDAISPLRIRPFNRSTKSCAPPPAVAIKPIRGLLELAPGEVWSARPLSRSSPSTVRALAPGELWSPGYGPAVPGSPSRAPPAPPGSWRVFAPFVRMDRRWRWLRWARLRFLLARASTVGVTVRAVIRSTGGGAGCAGLASLLLPRGSVVVVNVRAVIAAAGGGPGWAGLVLGFPSRAGPLSW
jgi:hypothetical protein